MGQYAAFPLYGATAVFGTGNNGVTGRAVFKRASYEGSVFKGDESFSGDTPGDACADGSAGLAGGDDLLFSAAWRGRRGLFVFTGVVWFEYGFYRPGHS